MEAKIRVIKGYFKEKKVDTSLPIPKKEVFSVLDNGKHESFDREVANEILPLMYFNNDSDYISYEKFV